jgi:flagellar motor protein MotB
MSQSVSEQFNQSLRSSPSGQRKSGTMFDEIYGALETSNNPLDRVIQMIAEFHGVWTGGSRELFEFSSFLASATGSNALKNVASQVGDATCRAETLNGQLPPSKVGRQNNEFAAIMPAPLLREFVTFAHNIHPALNMYFQLHAGNFPYFQQVSEEVGRFAHISSRITELSPLVWPLIGNPNCLNTNTRFDTNTMLKMFPAMFSQMDNASNLLNSLFLRSMRPDNNMALLKPEYGSDIQSAEKKLQQEKDAYIAKSESKIKDADTAIAAGDSKKAKELLDEAQQNTDLAKIKQNELAQIRQKKSGPYAHGHNFCMDVHGNQRRVDAVPGCAAVVMESSGDSLRLVNKFFPVRQVGKYETETFNITLNHGPNGEPVTFITDSRGRLFNNSNESNTTDDATNERMITAQDEYKEEKR